MTIGPPKRPAEASHASVLDGERGILAFLAFQRPGSPQDISGIFTMTGNRASSFEQSWHDVSEPLVHPVQRPLARPRRAMTEVPA